MSLVSVVCCQVEVSATSWSFVQRSPTECGVSKKCVIVKPRKMRRPRTPRGCPAIRKKMQDIRNVTVSVFIYVVSNGTEHLQKDA
jgi:hypothetical protein